MLLFILGMMAGAFAGIFLMCLLQICGRDEVDFDEKTE